MPSMSPEVTITNLMQKGEDTRKTQTLRRDEKWRGHWVKGWEERLLPGVPRPPWIPGSQGRRLPCLFLGEDPEWGIFWGLSGLWSSAATPYSAIDTWPGRRSGGMIVITSILGSLPFFLLVGFAGAIILSFV